jgi:hypothetical protein
LIQPFAHNRQADVRLVLVVRRNNLDFRNSRAGFLCEILGSHFGGHNGVLARKVGEWPRHVVQHADADCFLRLRQSGGATHRQQQGKSWPKMNFAAHISLLPNVRHQSI